MAELRVLLVDDEPLARKGLRQALARHPDAVVCGECRDGREAVDAIRAQRPHLVLLDVQMPELDGFGVLREVGVEHMPAVIFITAFDTFAVKAFDVHAVDYLVKPFDDTRFDEALARARQRLRAGEAAELGRRLAALLADAGPAPKAAGPPADRLLVRVGLRSVLVPVADIEWVEADDYCVTLHADGKAHVLRESLAALEARLDPERFVRIHRSAIVNVACIQEVHRPSPTEQVVVLRSGMRLRVSRSRREHLERRLGRAR
ncbi:DNA-binding response regulator [Corallococcus sp. AB004]|uniref:LytR/AlgR family response regulator transcription factor n=1 Tax=Corallococcus TaxID=83461 RepID=UPI000EA34ED5|nr:MULTISPECIES: response regulator transcription factor [Corallococcus]NPC70463.1 response regulator transcription factor [Corallococcus exiguus]NRD48297.1 response regulator transcription factor [Corallococcus exiguus]RKI04066.1 DNA-binding response regulator [Corallococcus sp. AB038B]RKI38616.1 DNA-binding response regulator [Corallococcus sp. AB004]